MASANPPALRAISRRSMLIAGFSTVVEWYDFTLYIYVATILSRVAFGGGKGSLAVVLAGFAVAYLMRPLGALAITAAQAISGSLPCGSAFR